MKYARILYWFQGDSKGVRGIYNTIPTKPVCISSLGRWQDHRITPESNILWSVVINMI